MKLQSPRQIPSIERLRQRPRVRALEERFGRDATLDALREVTGELRRALMAPGDAPPMPADAGIASRIEEAAARRLDREMAPSLGGAINATGVIIHTNLGRAPLAPVAARRVAELATGYTNLEYDLARGRRGARDLHAEALLCRLTGAEAAVVVNNNAGAILLVLAALTDGREVIISRGELVEIGGGFRVPDVMRTSGALLREVGTTNKTRAADYAAAIGDRTAMILRVHPSNFRIEGFTERPRLTELAALARRFGLPLVEDLGSGSLIQAQARGAGPIVPDPTVQSCLADGADLVCFSGDKLLGGPQAGIIAGRRGYLDRIRSHPLMRALRVDKMTYAALEATLQEYLAGRAGETVPVIRMLALGPDDIERRAREIARRLAPGTRIRTALIDGASTIGGGSAPGSALPTRLLALDLEGHSADALEARLRTLSPPIVARIENDRVVLDLRTVLPEQDEALAAALEAL